MIRWVQNRTMSSCCVIAGPYCGGLIHKRRGHAWCLGWVQDGWIEVTVGFIILSFGYDTQSDELKQWKTRKMIRKMIRNILCIYIYSIIIDYIWYTEWDTELTKCFCPSNFYVSPRLKHMLGVVWRHLDIFRPCSSQIALAIAVLTLTSTLPWYLWSMLVAL